MNDHEWASWLEAQGSTRRGSPPPDAAHWLTLLRQSEAAAHQLARQVHALQTQLEAARSSARDPVLMLLVGAISGAIGCYAFLR